MAVTIHELSAAPIVHRDPQGREHRFGRLTLINWGELQDALERRRKVNTRGLLMILKDIGLNMELMPAAIRQMTSDPTAREVMYFMQTPAGAAEVLRIAARLQGWTLTDDTIGTLAASPMDLIDLATDVANMPRKPAEDETEEERAAREAASSDPLPGTSADPI